MPDTPPYFDSDDWNADNGSATGLMEVGQGYGGGLVGLPPGVSSFDLYEASFPVYPLYKYTFTLYSTRRTTFYLTDQSGDTYKLQIAVPEVISRHEVSYNSDQPNIVKIE